MLLRAFVGACAAYSVGLAGVGAAMRAIGMTAPDDTTYYTHRSYHVVREAWRLRRPNDDRPYTATDLRYADWKWAKDHLPAEDRWESAL